MARQFKLARQFKNLKAVEAAELLGVSQPTLSAWETGRKSPSVDSLEKMADLYGVTTDFLLGRTKQLTNHMKEPISIEALPVMHGYPVWSSKFGWMLVDAVEKKLVTTNNFSVAFCDAGELFRMVPAFAEPILPQETPIPKSEIQSYDEIWLEPISTDNILRNELRGWYHVKDKWVENEFGNRFYLDTYASKWLGLSIQIWSRNKIYIIGSYCSKNLLSNIVLDDYVNKIWRIVK